MSWSDEFFKSMSWSDEFFNGLASGKDPPQQRKSKIKKLIREELNKNPVLSNVLRDNKAEGKFIKELTDKIIRHGWGDRIAKEHICIALNSNNPIDMAMTWRNTKQGHKYWDKINDIVIDRLSE
jgi:hypothetical protein